MIFDFTPTRQHSYAAARSSADIESFVARLRDIPLLGGRLLSDVELAAGVTTEISHGLDRVPTGWVLVDFKSGADDYPRTVSATRTHLGLEVTTAATVALWVF